MNQTLSASDGVTITAYRSGSADAPRAIVVLQEIFGVNHHIRDVCDRFAAQGYDVIAPALFDRATPGVELGYTPDDIQAGLKLRARIKPEDTLVDIRAAIDALQGKPAAVVGYCWGGALSWHAACQLDGLKAASCWYGGGIAQAKDQTARIPVQMHFGDQDGSIPMDDVRAIQAAQPQVDLHVYAGAGHGFGCDQRGSYHAQSYALAQQRTLEFFARHLA